MSRLQYRPSPAMVVAVVALFVALGGGAYAAFRLPANSVGSKQLKRHAVTPTKVAPATVRLFRGQTGDRGVQGLKGDTGPTGPSDVYADGTGNAALTSSHTAYGQTTVPAGSYLLEGKANFNAGASGGRMSCKLAPDTSAFPYWDEAFATGGASEVGVVLSLSAVQTFASAQTVELVCKTDSGTGSIDNARVIAIKTGTAHGTTPHD
jgi:hypothetical protein